MHKISLPAHINEYGGEIHMANKNNSNQPTNAAEVRKQNQQSAQKGYYQVLIILSLEQMLMPQ